MKATDTPAQCLAIAKTVESMMETEKLSKSFLQNINKPEISEVDSVHNQKKGFKGPGCKQRRSRRQCGHSGGYKNKCRNCGSTHSPRSVQHMERSASYARRRDISNNTVIVLHKTIVVMAESPGKTCMILIRMKKYFRCKTMIQLMCELCILPLMFIIQLTLTLFLMRYQVIGNFNIFSQM